MKTKIIFIFLWKNSILKSFNLNSFHPFISRGINIAHSHLNMTQNIFTQLFSYTNILHDQLTLTHCSNIFIN